jgi:hypothetical protein
MRADIVPGGTFPDYELTDHTKIQATELVRSQRSQACRLRRASR